MGELFNTKSLVIGSENKGHQNIIYEGNKGACSWTQQSYILYNQRFFSRWYTVQHLTKFVAQQKCWTMLHKRVERNRAGFYFRWTSFNNIQRVEWHISTFNMTRHTVQHLLNKSCNICFYFIFVLFIYLFIYLFYFNNILYKEVTVITPIHTAKQYTSKV